MFTLFNPIALPLLSLNLLSALVVILHAIACLSKIYSHVVLRMIMKRQSVVKTMEEVWEGICTQQRLLLLDVSRKMRKHPENIHSGFGARAQSGTHCCTVMRTCVWMLSIMYVNFTSLYLQFKCSGGAERRLSGVHCPA